MPDEKTGRLDEEYVVQMKGITKVYPNGVAANQGVDFNLRRGEIHALMGENGAGKSTLMKMLFGLEQPTSGEIWVHGEKLTLSSPTVAISHGIGMVHQHFMLVPSLTVAENMVLGMAPQQGFCSSTTRRPLLLRRNTRKNTTCTSSRRPKSWTSRSA